MSTVRQLQGEFAGPGHAAGPGVSLVRRPDALSPDYRTDFAPGPRALGDAGAGLRDRPWRARAAPGGVWLARASDAGTAWEAEVSLLTHTGAPIDEVGLAFDQNGRATVAAERATGPGGAPEVWLLSYDPVAAAHTFTRLGAGRTPRVVMDQPQSAESEMLVFYVSDAADGVVLRRQRDRYAAEHPTPIGGAAGLFLEAAVWDGAGRLRLFLARRDPASSSHALLERASTLYPLYTSGADSPLAPGVSLRGLQVRRMVLTQVVEAEGTAPALHTLGALRVFNPAREHRAPADSGYTAGHQLLGVQVRTLVVTHVQDADGEQAHTVGHELRGIQVRPVLLTHTQPADGDGTTPSHELRGLDVVRLVQ